jgi:hypothetical protein
MNDHNRQVARPSLQSGVPDLWFILDPLPLIGHG